MGAVRLNTTHPISLPIQRPRGIPQRPAGPSHKSSRQQQRRSCQDSNVEASSAVETEEKGLMSDALRARMATWTWRDKKINYLIMGEGPPLLLVHGFAGSILHFRNNIPVLAQSYTVYAIDLLGFGGSEKALVEYSLELWRDLILDFTQEWISGPFMIVGNSIGSLSSLMATVEMQERVLGMALLNCAGSLNNKGLTDDWRIRLSLPVFYFVDFLLSIRPVAQYLFSKLATEETVRSILKTIYCNKEAVDDELVEIFTAPSRDDGALDVFVSIITAPGGPRPEPYLCQVTCPLLVLWGEDDTLTPFINPVSNFLRECPNATFIPLSNTGHALHDDQPDLVHQYLLPWLEQTHQSDPFTKQS